MERVAAAGGRTPGSAVSVPVSYTHLDVYKRQPLNRRSVNDGKVTDHHALIVTENLPGERSKDERAVYELVSGRMLEAFSGRWVKDVTTAVMSAGDTDFTV